MNISPILFIRFPVKTADIACIPIAIITASGNSNRYDLLADGTNLVKADGIGANNNKHNKIILKRFLLLIKK